MVGKSAGLARAPIVFAVMVILCVAGIATFMLLQGRGKPPGDNQLPPTGAVFSENFTGESLESLQTQGWSVWYKPRMKEVLQPEYENATFPPETVSVENDAVLKATGAGGFMYSANWSNYILTFKFTTGVNPDVPGNFWCGLAFRSDNTWTSGTVDLSDNGSWPQNSYILQLGYQWSTNRLWKIVNGTWTEIASEARSVALDDWHDVKLEASGSSLKVYLDNQLLISATDGSLTSGGIGLLNCSGPVYFDDVVMTT